MGWERDKSLSRVRIKFCACILVQYIKGVYMYSGVFGDACPFCAPAVATYVVLCTVGAMLTQGLHLYSLALQAEQLE
jgi:hypothetical protein